MKGVGSGKVMETLRWAHETGGTVVCATEEQAAILKTRAAQYGLDVIITVADKKLHGAAIRQVFFDSMDNLLQELES